MKRLNLAGNRLVHLEDSNFASLIHLTYLDLSHNNAMTFENKGRMFLGLEQSLQHLKLKNISLIFVSKQYAIIFFYKIFNNMCYYFSDTRVAATVSSTFRFI